MKTYAWIVAGVLGTLPAMADTPAPSPRDIISHVLDSDSLGLVSSSIVAHATLTDRTNARSDLAFTSHSKRIGPSISESIVRFSAPADLAGAGFLQIQKSDADDDRFLYLPDLKRSRRISGSLRDSAFMGTDLSFADLDRRDLRESTPTLLRSENLQKWDCYVLDVVPTRDDSQYSHLELWVRKDNYVPLQMKMYDHARTLMKTFTALEIKRVSGQWFISKSRMVNHQQNHTTELTLDQIVASDSSPDDAFTVRALEKGE